MQSRCAKYTFFVLFLAVLIPLVSCGGIDASVTAVYPRVVFSYDANDKNNPDVYLSVFGDITGDVWRIGSVSLSHRDSGFRWNADEVEIEYGMNDDSTYAGYSAFRPYDVTFSAGIYTITWHEKNGRSFSTDFTLPEQNPILPEDESVVSSILIQAADSSVLYAGPVSSDVRSPEAISAKYPAAAVYRKYAVTNSTRSLYMYPPVVVQSVPEVISEMEQPQKEAQPQISDTRTRLMKFLHTDKEN